MVDLPAARSHGLNCRFSRSHRQLACPVFVNENVEAVELPLFEQRRDIICFSCLKNLKSGR